MPPSIIWKGNTGLVPQWEGFGLALADRVTRSDVYRGSYLLCESSTLLRGTYGSGFRNGWVVTSSAVKAQRKGIGILTINWEIGGPYADPFFLPLDDYRSETVELYPKVERNKEMFGPTYPANPNDRIAVQTIALCYQAARGVPPKDQLARTAIELMYDRDSDPPVGTTWEDQFTFAAVLLRWLDIGYETYYLVGTKYSHIWYSFTFPPLSAGGVIEPFPTGGPRAGDASLSWLRLADNPEPAGVNGSVHKITSTWLGGPTGHWDSVLYKP